ncbi:rRNA 2'-O-methyltransferase fibrillarin-like [Oryza brachyantha]|uniref:rRNA 2'-O-methyltransferase fibrillarin-like n=1 Tax=Oryza brachyantha TaxID=4533 RepID=UPI001ADB260A|nr:rRNA 2'-O-methyltransferase fibrillarin-like [Oryza brachyantha]
MEVEASDSGGAGDGAAAAGGGGGRSWTCPASRAGGEERGEHGGSSYGRRLRRRCRAMEPRRPVMEAPGGGAGRRRGPVMEVERGRSMGRRAGGAGGGAGPATGVLQRRARSVCLREREHNGRDIDVHGGCPFCDRYADRWICKNNYSHSRAQEHKNGQYMQVGDG